MPSRVAGYAVPQLRGGSDFAGLRCGSSASAESVFGLGASLAERLTTGSPVALRPRSVAAPAAAALPTVSLTVAVGLGPGGLRLVCGELLLVHAASGGVGLAALAAARRLGAQVLGTASSAAKAQALRLRGLRLVAPSRHGRSFLLDFFDFDFAAPVVAPAVAAVLNSLTHDDFVPRSLTVLVPGGRILELGKLK
ncbi:unnamed protein product, partial [Effrenium voratum]